MTWTNRTLGVVIGLIVGIGVGVGYRGLNQPVWAMVDRHEESILCTGQVAVNHSVRTDGIWLLDYRTGKLLGTVIDRTQGKIMGWAEVDLRTEFGVVAQQDVHFLMTTGYITQGQSALYLAETSTGQFGVYTMGPGENGSGIAIRRHDLGTFRQQVAAQPNNAPQPRP